MERLLGMLMIALLGAGWSLAHADQELPPGVQHSIYRYPSPSGLGLFDQAAALEREGRGPEAVELYERAARSGSANAAKRLGEIYDKGIDGVPRDYANSLKWYNAARALGDIVPLGPTR